MKLSSLAVQGLRVIEDLTLDVDADLVLITGPNGSGKTSILEAIHLLGTGRSFRARSVQDVVARGAERLLVRGLVVDDSGGESRVGVEKPRRGDARMRIAGEDVRTASRLARHLPLVVITPESQRLLSDGAEVRRRLLDWLLFHVEPTYQDCHARYRRALRQRNAALRRDDTTAAQRSAWCAEMAQAGEALHRVRERGLQSALGLLEAALEELSGLPITLRFEPGWDVEQDLEPLLQREWGADALRGFSRLGPHRCDLQIRVENRPAQHVVSRGEGKVLAMAVMVGFARVLATSSGRRPLVLVDELASELDASNRTRLSLALKDLGLQTLVTAVSERLVETAGWTRVTGYRMEQGKAARMLQ